MLLLLLCGSALAAEKLLPSTATTLPQDSLTSAFTQDNSPNRRSNQRAAGTRKFNNSNKEKVEPDEPFFTWEKKNASLAMLLSAIVPGAGQIYNEEYWYIRLPIIWGGGYLLYRWFENSREFYDLFNNLNNEYEYFLRQKSQFPNAKFQFSGVFDYLNNTDIDDETLKSFFESRRDSALEKRELAIVFLGLGYFLQVLDAFVVAKFTTFDINENLQVEVQPLTIDYNPTFNQPSVNVGISLKF